MSDSNRTYRIKANVGVDTNLSLNLEQEYDTFEILSLKLGEEDLYRLHTSNYGVVVGRVLANNGFGIENAKVSIFISADTETMSKAIESQLYPYRNITDKDSDGHRYNLLNTDELDDCHTVVGSFPSKSYLLDNDVLLEIFDKYYKYTVRTNHAGDYMIVGVPTGQQVLHVDLDLSDCGILSQRPRDFVYQGYTIEQFENANQFKGGSELDTLSHIFTQNISIDVIPFWGNSTQNETIGITRQDINISFTFQPTCVFMGSVIGDNQSNGISQKGVPTNNMGAMDELTTGEGTIEMIRKTPMGTVEEFQVKGTEVINGDGVWCYQIPMNLDYVMHDEYGNIVPTNNPNKGIPTRAKVRFRVSMHEFGGAQNGYYRAKVLIPHNPKYATDAERVAAEDTMGDILDYSFGSNTDDNSFRDLFWNNVYTVKSYIPRFQKSQFFKFTPTERFTGIKHCNIYGQNNPMPYNNIRIRLPLMFTILCAIIKSYIRIVQFVNGFINVIVRVIDNSWNIFLEDERAKGLSMVVLSDGLCPDLEGWYFAPTTYLWTNGEINPLETTYTLLTQGEIKTERNEKKERNKRIREAIKYVRANWERTGNLISGYYRILPDGIRKVKIFQEIEFLWPNGNDATDEILEMVDPYINGSRITAKNDNTAIDTTNKDESSDNNVCLTTNIDYLLSCVEMNLAQEYKVVNFDFYNDWINGTIYMPRWRRIQRGKTLFRLIRNKPVIRGFMSADSENLDPNGNNPSRIKYKTWNATRKYTQQCSMSYTLDDNSVPKLKYAGKGCTTNGTQACHKFKGTDQISIFGKNNGGIVHAAKTLQNEYVYYFKPCEWFVSNSSTKKVNLYANDLVLLGSLNDCSIDGIPQAFKYLTNSSYKMPTNLALTNMESDGYLYAIDDDEGTMCASHEGTSGSGRRTSTTTAGGGGGGVNTVEDRIDDEEYIPEDGSGNGGTGTIPTASKAKNEQRNLGSAGVTRVDNTFTAMTQYTKGTDNQIKYNASSLDIDDYVAITEAPGISWDYWGPDQGHTALTGTNIEKQGYVKGFYQPGGLFLGLSCFVSETNIKSCINLSRVCEMGVDLPGRRELVIGSDANNYLKYKYLVPTGLVSLDDITSTDFRAMFATLNHKRLIATKIQTNDKSVGDDYNKYEFYYLRPNNFDGAFSEWTKTNYYNAHLTEGEEFVVEKDLLGAMQYEPDIAAEITDISENTYRRTMEAASVDYWKFRLGIDDLTPVSKRSKFLVAGGKQGGYALPQYENSYYFYFGLHEGATALDELNKEFFSTCVKKNNDITEDATNPVTSTYILPSSANLRNVGEFTEFRLMTNVEGDIHWSVAGNAASNVTTSVTSSSALTVTYNSLVSTESLLTVSARVGDLGGPTANASLTLETSATPVTTISIRPTTHTFSALNQTYEYSATTNSSNSVSWAMVGDGGNYCTITPSSNNTCTVTYVNSITAGSQGTTVNYYIRASVDGVSAQAKTVLTNTHEHGGDASVRVTPATYTFSTTGRSYTFTATLVDVSTVRWVLDGGNGYVTSSVTDNTHCRITYTNYVPSDTSITLTAIGDETVQGSATITLKRDSSGDPSVTVSPSVYTFNTTGSAYTFTATAVNTQPVSQWSLSNISSSYAIISNTSSTQCTVTYNNYVDSQTIGTLIASNGSVQDSVNIVFKPESVVPPTPTGTFTITGLTYVFKTIGEEKTYKANVPSGDRVATWHLEGNNGYVHIDGGGSSVYATLIFDAYPSTDTTIKLCAISQNNLTGETSIKLKSEVKAYKQLNGSGAITEIGSDETLSVSNAAIQYDIYLSGANGKEITECDVWIRNSSNPYGHNIAPDGAGHFLGTFFPVTLTGANDKVRVIRGLHANSTLTSHDKALFFIDGDNDIVREIKVDKA